MYDLVVSCRISVPRLHREIVISILGLVTSGQYFSVTLPTLHLVSRIGGADEAEREAKVLLWSVYDRIGGLREIEGGVR